MIQVELNINYITLCKTSSLVSFFYFTIVTDSPQLSTQLDINSLFSKLLQTGIIRKVRADSPQNAPPTSDAPPTSVPMEAFASVQQEDSQDSQSLDMDNLKITMEPCSPEEMHIPKIGLKSDELKV